MLTFKKTIACLMSLIMIMTVTPFTAVTASAATAKIVSSNIDETNKKYHAAPSTTFTPKTGMSEVSWLNSAEVNEVSSSDGKFHKQSYAPSSNVLYWPSAYVGTTDCLQFQKNHLDFRAYYPSAVLMWDGTTEEELFIMLHLMTVSVYLMPLRRLTAQISMLILGAELKLNKTKISTVICTVIIHHLVLKQRF